MFVAYLLSIKVKFPCNPPPSDCPIGSGLFSFNAMRIGIVITVGPAGVIFLTVPICRFLLFSITITTNLVFQNLKCFLSVNSFYCPQFHGKRPMNFSEPARVLLEKNLENINLEHPWCIQTFLCLSRPAMFPALRSLLLVLPADIVLECSRRQLVLVARCIRLVLFPCIQTLNR